MLFYHLSLVENEFRDSFRHFYTASSSKIRRVCTSMYSYTPTVPPAHIPVLYTVPGTLENNPRSLATPYLFYSIYILKYLKVPGNSLPFLFFLYSEIFKGP